MTSSDGSADPGAGDGLATRRRYDRQARTFDIVQWLPDKLAFGRLRKKLWRDVQGDRVLEIGVGTGRNIPLHPPGTRVVAIDISRPMLRRAAHVADHHRREVDLVQADATRLPFRPGVFDAAAATFVFCSVPDPVAGLAEARRVLRPGARLHLLEHIRSPWRAFGRVMDWINPVAVRLSGANINRQTPENVRRGGFDVDVVDRAMAGILVLMRGAPAPESDAATKDG